MFDKILDSFESILENLSDELMLALKEMQKAKSSTKKLEYSQIVRNLSETLNDFLRTLTTLLAEAQDIAPADDYIDDNYSEDEVEDYEEDDDDDY
ncbi:MAG TPA: hypothetical protein ENG14_00820 [Thermodesulforhabdus norvegica]|uniref:Uncharacterized protein n=1 Tax=Thermodesulforhabdus norvegica TaxID=39841 RepID=A0A7C0WR80_9BACT|nr:hypothetical protein [Deltaproteobacteria bacterium]MBW2067690.1 hypothetical protein [Deltaproteobacteria bacterium]HDL89429.1 hypothetical protein [Thermodesulforhabdus norvegica]